MWKTGIYRIDDLRGDATTRLRGEPMNISVTLYPAVCESPGLEPWAERILDRFSDQCGAFKRTYAGRFDDFDRRVTSRLKESWDGRSLRIHDVGVSDARTSVDWFQTLVKSFPSVEYMASDFQPTVWVLVESRCTVTVTEAGELLEIVYPPFVFNCIKRDSYRHYPINHLVRSWVQRYVAEPLAEKYRRHQIAGRAIQLFAPEAVRLDHTDARFQLSQHDMTGPMPQNVDCVRAMNVLNPSYFSDDQFDVILANFYDGLSDKGFLVTGSNGDAGSPVDGGVYRKTDTGFSLVESFGGGSPIADRIERFRSS
ncbi:hypothetical protein [Crateriforma conspicua]|uniref:Uncharacterized protein n=1 Tax=Crateriforma conspicua TaxID=2527996 RepID=A0A5C5XZY6_9PLAN|nr:hypothetical protein [Crateriforma conspicua]QDV62930.1 hypothetical protein Mal65_20670 [Crateriforma conspicua]TWT68298.1 hypothetical protein Pan14r_05420 [Crateriforma conspicua]